MNAWTKVLTASIDNERASVSAISELEADTHETDGQTTDGRTDKTRNAAC